MLLKMRAITKREYFTHSIGRKYVNRTAQHIVTSMESVCSNIHCLAVSIDGLFTRLCPIPEQNKNNLTHKTCKQGAYHPGTLYFGTGFMI